MFKYLDENLIIFYPNKAANRWAALRLELVGNLMIFSAAFFAVLARDSISSGLAGVSISLSLSVGDTIWNLCELEPRVEVFKSTYFR